jgi:hypothetical protein
LIRRFVGGVGGGVEPPVVSSTTSTQSLVPSECAAGYAIERLAALGSDAEMTVYDPVVGSYQRSRTGSAPAIAVVSTTIERDDGK